MLHHRYRLLLVVMVGGRFLSIAPFTVVVARLFRSCRVPSLNTLWNAIIYRTKTRRTPLCLHRYQVKGGGGERCTIRFHHPRLPLIVDVVVSTLSLSVAFVHCRPETGYSSVLTLLPPDCRRNQGILKCSQSINHI